MNDHTKKIYRFGKFDFDAEGLVLYYEGELVKAEGEAGNPFSGKPLEILKVLVERKNEVVTNKEIIEKLWQSQFGYGKKNIPPHITKLQTVLKKYEPDNEYIKSVKNRGYIFVGKIFEDEEGDKTENAFISDFVDESDIFQESPPLEVSIDSATRYRKEFSQKKEEEEAVKPSAVYSDSWRVISLCVIGFAVMLAVGFLAWHFISTPEREPFPLPSDKAEIRRIVEDSQKYESLILYANPSNFNEKEIAKYWLAENNLNDEFDIKKIREGVQNLIRKELYYGGRTKCEQFEFVSIDINETGDYAVANTIEKWFIETLNKDGSLYQEKVIGPRSVSYILRKINGQWLIEKSTTPRASPSPAAS